MEPRPKSYNMIETLIWQKHFMHPLWRFPDLLLDKVRVCTGQDDNYLIEVESTGLKLILGWLISPKLFMGDLFEHFALLLCIVCLFVCVLLFILSIRIVQLTVNFYRLVYCLLKTVVFDSSQYLKTLLGVTMLSPLRIKLLATYIIILPIAIILMEHIHQSGA